MATNFAGAIVCGDRSTEVSQFEGRQQQRGWY